MPSPIIIPQVWPDRIKDLAGQPANITARIALGLFRHGLMSSREVLNYTAELEERFPSEPNPLLGQTIYGAYFPINNPITSHIVEGNNYKVGEEIDFAVKIADQEFILTPKVPITSAEQIRITYHKRYYVQVQVGDRFQAGINFSGGHLHLDYIDKKPGEHYIVNPLEDLIKSLGFEKPEHFFQMWPENFKGKIVTWV